MENQTLKMTNNGDGYPMYFKIKDKVIEKIADTSQVKSQRTVGIAVTESVKPGDTLVFNNTEHLVVSASEPRPCKGNHPVKGVIFQEVVTNFVDNI